MTDIHAQNSACEADYPTELRKMADLIDRSGLRHTAEMVREGADELERYREALERIAEMRDTGRHDGIPEQAPRLCDWEMCQTARVALKQETVSDERGARAFLPVVDSSKGEEKPK